MVTAQRKVNKGLEDYKSAIIEVSEEEMMSDFEVELKTDKVEMPNIARQIRERILPLGDFVSFGRLACDIDVDIIKDAFDLRLAEIIKTKHNEKAENEVMDIVKNAVDKYIVKSKTVTAEGIELTTEIRVKDAATDFVNRVNDVVGVSAATLVTFNGDYMS